MRTTSVSVGSVLVVAVLLGACSSGGDDDSARASRTAGSASAPTRASTAESVGHEWEVHGHDLANTRTNVTENVINAASVATLTKSWETDGAIGVTGDTFGLSLDMQVRSDRHWGRAGSLVVLDNGTPVVRSSFKTWLSP